MVKTTGIKHMIKKNIQCITCNFANYLSLLMRTRCQPKSLRKNGLSLFIGTSQHTVITSPVGLYHRKYWTLAKAPPASRTVQLFLFFTLVYSWEQKTCPFFQILSTLNSPVLFMLGFFKAKDTIGCNSADKIQGFAAPAT